MEETLDQDTSSSGADHAERRRVLDLVLSEAAFEGFTASSLDKAASTAGAEGQPLPAGELERLFPRGVADVLAFWSSEEDRAMQEAFEALNPKPRGVTAQITWLIRQRIEQLDWNREAARRAGAALALPTMAGLGPQLLWATADAMWRAINDPSTDFNFYTKRASLSTIYTATLSRWFAEQGDAAGEDPYAKTWAFLDARMDNLMQFEKFKGRVQKAVTDPRDIIGALARVRYGSGR